MIAFVPYGRMYGDIREAALIAQGTSIAHGATEATPPVVSATPDDVARSFTSARGAPVKVVTW